MAKWKKIKRAPLIGDPKIDRVIKQIYSDMNKLVEAVNEGDSISKKEDNIGSPGDIRVVRNSDGLYAIEAKTDDGWITTTPSTMTIKGRS